MTVLRIIAAVVAATLSIGSPAQARQIFAFAKEPAPYQLAFFRRAAPQPIAQSGGGGGAFTPIANNGTTYFIASNGNDNNSGTDQAHPWAHPPHVSLLYTTISSGVWAQVPDPTVSPTSISQTTVLGPGDKLSFKGGDTFYYQFSPTWNGEAGSGNGASGNALYIVGGEWGDTTKPAVFLGSDPVDSVVPCPDAPTCGNNPNWAQLSYITYHSTEYSPRFFQCTDSTCRNVTMLYESQFPAPPNYFFSDDNSSYDTITSAQLGSLALGVLPGQSDFITKISAAGATGAAKLIVHGGQNLTADWWVTGFSGSNINVNANGTFGASPFSGWAPVYTLTGSISGSVLSVTGNLAGSAYSGSSYVSPVGYLVPTGASALLSDLSAIPAGVHVTSQLSACGASFTGSISSGTLNVTAVASGTLGVGSEVTGAGITNNAAYISGFVSGSNGGVGVYTIAGAPASVASETLAQPCGGLGTYNLDTSVGTVASETMAISTNTVQLALRNLAYLIDPTSSYPQFSYLVQGCTTGCHAVAYLPNGSAPLLVSGGQSTQTVTGYDANPNDPVFSRSGIQLSPTNITSYGPQWIYISGLRFTGFAQSQGEDHAGQSITNEFWSGSFNNNHDVEVVNVDFEQSGLMARTQALLLTKVSNIHVKNNTFNFVDRSSAIELYGTNAKNGQYSEIVGNAIGWIGKTGIDIYGANAVMGVQSVPVTAGGTGCTSASISFSGSAPDIATGTVTVSGGAVTGVNVTYPGYYPYSAPSATLTTVPSNCGATIGSPVYGAVVVSATLDVSSNAIYGAQGIHGNCVSVYAGATADYNVKIHGNSIAHCYRPIRTLGSHLFANAGNAFYGNILNTDWSTADEIISGAVLGTGAQIYGNLAINTADNYFVGAYWGSNNQDANTVVQGNYLQKLSGTHYCSLDPLGLITNRTTPCFSSATVTSGTYDPTTGLIVLNFASQPTFLTVGGIGGVQTNFSLASPTGSGTNLSQLDGYWPYVSMTTTSLTLQGPTGLGSISLTGGSVNPFRTTPGNYTTTTADTSSVMPLLTQSPLVPLVPLVGGDGTQTFCSILKPYLQGPVYQIGAQFYCQ